jgi:CDGSH-type Zn-finger protein
VDIYFHDPDRSSVEVRSEALLCPGHSCHLPFCYKKGSDIRKKFEEKDEIKRKQKTMFFGYREASKT